MGLSRRLGLYKSSLGVLDTSMHRKTSSDKLQCARSPPNIWRNLGNDEFLRFFEALEISPCLLSEGVRKCTMSQRHLITATSRKSRAWLGMVATMVSGNGLYLTTVVPRCFAAFHINQLLLRLGLVVPGDAPLRLCGP